MNFLYPFVIFLVGCTSSKLLPFIPQEKSMKEIDVALKTFTKQKGQTKMMNNVVVGALEETTQSSDNGNEGLYCVLRRLNIQ